MPTATGSSSHSTPSTQYHKFSLTVEAIKNVPVVGPHGDGTTYSLSWHYDDLRQGATSEITPTGDEVVFNYSTEFVAEHQGAISRLLQVNVVAIRSSGDRELGGVLMIDLNAHVPKPPSKLSKQRATLNMSRCTGSKPLLIRLSISGAPTTAPPSGGMRSAPSSRGHSLQSSPAVANLHLSRGPSPPPQHGTGAGGGAAMGEDALAEQLHRLQATVSALSAANDQLKDENTLLRMQSQKGRVEPDYTYTGGGGGGGVSASQSSLTFATPLSHPLQATGSGVARSNSVSPAPINPVTQGILAFEAEEQIAKLQTEIKTLNAEIVILQKGLQSAREQIKLTVDREEKAQRDVTTLLRNNRALEDEIARLKGHEHVVNQRYETALGIMGTSTDEVLTNREVMVSTQAMNRDLRAMVDSLENSNKDLQRQLSETRKQIADNDRKTQLTITQYQTREQEATLRADRAESMLQALQAQNKQLHDYCCMANERCKQLSTALSAEHEVAEKRKKKVNDLRAILSAHVAIEKNLSVA
jgi:hypothetical protein